MNEPPVACPGPREPAPRRARLGLVLPGGGARGAYQVGVLKALMELGPDAGPVPFRIITGTSAGAIIAALVAANAMHFREGMVSLERFWRNFHVDQVYRADTASMLRAGLHWLLALVSGGRLAPPPHAVLDDSPLRELLERHVNFARIEQALDHGYLDALAIHASPYRGAHAQAFYAAGDAHEQTLRPWPAGVATELGLDHLMASAAVPFLFRPVRIAGEYYGDGAMRETEPLAAAINLGAERLLIIGVRSQPPPALPATDRGNGEPTFGQIFGYMLDTLFMDGVSADLEHLRRDNLLIDAAGGQIADLRKVKALHIAPQQDFGPVAERHAAEMPRALRTLLRTLGAENPGGRMLLSYLLFESGYTRELIAIGYCDAMQRRDELQALLSSEA